MGKDCHPEFEKLVGLAFLLISITKNRLLYLLIIFIFLVTSAIEAIQTAPVICPQAIKTETEVVEFTEC